MDVDARIQVFDLKTKYQFQTIPGIDQYNMPLYSIQTQPGNQQIGPFPVYQGFMAPARANGIDISFYSARSSFFNLWPNYVQNQTQVAIGDGTEGPYDLTIPFFPAIPGHIDITGIIAARNFDPTVGDPPFVTAVNAPTFIQTVPTTSVYSGVYFTSIDTNGNNVVVADSGLFLAGGADGDLLGILLEPGQAPLGNQPLGSYSLTENVINYNTGEATVEFNTPILDGAPINAQCYFYSQGIPRACLFYNNCLTLRSPPNTQYLIELDAYLSPAAFLATGAAIPFGYMAEYIARGSARKILADTGDVEQFQFYEPLFKEQEILVWKRSQRIFTSTRTETIYSNSGLQANVNSIGQT